MLAGAALDTHYAYPLPAEHPLWSFPNVILTPHIGGSTLDAWFETERFVIEKAARVFGMAVSSLGATV